MSSTRIVVTRALPERELSRLRARGDVWANTAERALAPAELQDVCRGATAIVATGLDLVDAALLDAAGPQLRVVANVAVGYNNLDLAAAAARGVTVTNTPDVLTDATADFALALLLAATRRVAEGDRLVRSGAPWTWQPRFMLGHELRGAVLGIVGLGRIGRAVARRAVAFGMKIRYSSRSTATAEIEDELQAQPLPLSELLQTADIISLHCPLTPTTHHLISAPELRAMKPSAVLINTARGPIVDENALASALIHGEIAAAALDVYEHEPEVTSELLSLENVVLAPHLGSATPATRDAMASLAVDNVLRVLDGLPPLTPIAA